MYRLRLWIEFSAIGAVSALSAWAVIRSDFFDRFYAFTRSHETWELDEIILALPVLVLGLLIFAIRRIRETTREAEARLDAEQKARAAEAKAMAMHKMKEEFMVVMSHELRTPLNGIMATLALLASEELADQQRELVDIALASAKNLNRLLNDVMEFAQIQDEPHSDMLERFSPAMVLHATHQSFTIPARAKGVAMPEPDVSGLPDLVQGREGICRQVLLNLTGNAVKFTEQGSVTLRGRFEPGKDGEGLGLLIFEVADTGPGIAAKDLDRIFEPFTQLDQSLQRKKGGIGLGLSLVKRLVDFMGGTVEVESEPGSGSTFRVRVPVVVQAQSGAGNYAMTA